MLVRFVDLIWVKNYSSMISDGHHFNFTKSISIMDIQKCRGQATNHEQLFGSLRNDFFSAEEAAEYLEVSIPTFRRHVQSGRIKPKETIGRSQLFATADLRKLKQKLYWLIC
jgi:excisionase family DNA binding protein